MNGEGDNPRNLNYLNVIAQLRILRILRAARLHVNWILPQFDGGDNMNSNIRFNHHVPNNVVAGVADERNNPPVDLNGQNDDNIGVVAGIGNNIAHEAVKEAVDVHQAIPEEDPLPGVSRQRSREWDDEGLEEWYEFGDYNPDNTDYDDDDPEGINQQVAEEMLPSGSTKRSREEDVEDEEHASKIIRLANPDPEAGPNASSHTERGSDEPLEDSYVDDPEGINQQVAEEMLPSGSTKRSREEDVEDEEHASKIIRLANPDPEAGPNASSHTERGSDEPLEDAPQELDIHRAGGSRKRSREDCEEEEEDLSPRKFRRSSNESTSSTEDNQ